MNGTDIVRGELYPNILRLTMALCHIVSIIALAYCREFISAIILFANYLAVLS
jgi:hypothetical protein